MQRRSIFGRHATLGACFGARSGALSSATILLALSTACSNAAPAMNHSPGSVESVASNTDDSNTDGSTTDKSKYVVGYLPNWRGALSGWTRTLDFSALTHVTLAFATVETGTDGLEVHYRQDGATSGDEPGLAAFVEKAHAATVKVCLAVAGGSPRSEAFAEEILKAPKELADKVASYAETHDLDCIDVDQEEQFPTLALDAKYGEFIRELRLQLNKNKKHMQLSAAVATWNPNKVLPVIDQFDFLNVMAYDFYNPSSLKTPTQGSSIADAQQELEYWFSKGAPRSKLMWGVPFYGFKWSGAGGTGAPVTYSGIIQEFGKVPTEDEVETQTSTITLNSSATIRSKAELAKESYGGVMIWELGQDATDEQSLLQVVKRAMQGQPEPGLGEFGASTAVHGSPLLGNDASVPTSG